MLKASDVDYEHAISKDHCFKFVTIILGMHIIYIICLEL